MSGIYENTLGVILDHYSDVIEGGNAYGGGQIFNGVAGLGSSRPWLEFWTSHGSAHVPDAIRDSIIPDGSESANRAECVTFLQNYPRPLFISVPDFRDYDAQDLNYGKGEQLGVAPGLLYESAAGMCVRLAGFSTSGANNITMSFSMSALDGLFPKANMTQRWLEGFSRLPDGIDPDDEEMGIPGGFDRSFWWTVDAPTGAARTIGQTMYLETGLSLKVRFDRNHTHFPHQPQDRYISTDLDKMQAHFEKDRLSKVWTTAAILSDALMVPNHKETTNCQSLTPDGAPDVETLETHYRVSIPFSLVYRLDGRFL